MPIDPRRFATSVEEATAHRLADAERRLSAQERGSFNRVVAAARVYTFSEVAPVGLTIVDFADAEYDTAGMWIASQPSRITPPTPGIYHLNARVRFATNTTGYRSIMIQGNGIVGYGELTVPPATVETSLSTSATAVVETGDYFELKVEQSTTGLGTLALDACSMSAFYVGAVPG